ncbi:MAG: hypothetical protein WAQ98_33765 [Blastocatellia bacterium]
MLQILNYIDYKNWDRRTKLILLAMGIIALIIVLKPAKEQKPLVAQILNSNGKAWTDYKLVVKQVNSSSKSSSTTTLSDIANIANIADIAAFRFSDDGKMGLIISSEGNVLASSDGGRTWFVSSRIPLNGEVIEGQFVANETITDLTINSNSSQVFVSTMLEGAELTNLYQLKDGKWSVNGGDYAGITALSSNGSWGVGGGGYFYQISQTGELLANRLPDWAENTTLYSVSNKGNELLLVGDYGLSVVSKDFGKSWSFTGVRTDLPLYSCLMGEGISLIGGIGSLYCSLDDANNQQIINSNVANSNGANNSNVINNSKAINKKWYQVKGLSDRAAIFSFYQDQEAKEVFAVGGSLDGGKGLILSTTDGVNWYQETVDDKYGRVISIAKTPFGFLAATASGKVLIRQDLNLTTKNN